MMSQCPSTYIVVDVEAVIPIHSQLLQGVDIRLSHDLHITLENNTGREREKFYLTTHSTHFIYGYMASDIWLRTILIVRKETRCHT